MRVTVLHVEAGCAIVKITTSTDVTFTVEARDEWGPPEGATILVEHAGRVVLDETVVPSREGA